MKGWIVVLGGPNLQMERGANFGKPLKMDKIIYMQHASAVEAAEQLALKNPQQQVLLFESNEVIETVRPKILNKKITSEGEVIV